MGEVIPLQELPKFTNLDRISVPINHIPLFRTTIANQNGVQDSMIFKTWGGLGDQVCAGPTLSYALKTFRNCEISLHSEHPELFSHLKFHKVFHAKKDKPPDWNKYLVFETITPPNDSNLVWQFFSHMLTNCVDFPSLCALRSQLPVADREILLSPRTPEAEEIRSLRDGVFVHAGRHWPSKTFPKWWWDGVIQGLIANGVTPILIGADTDDNRGTVDVDASGSIDLRNKTTVSELAWLMQHAKVLLTNDSSPMHMAASRDPNDFTTGLTWIGYIATCKHPDYITHWRKPPKHYESDKESLNVWQWREENLGLGGMWEITSPNPNQNDEITVDKVDAEILASWLPSPESVVQWTLNKLV